ESRDYTVFINASGDCEKDLKSVAVRFNEDIWDHDSGPSLNRISKRFEELGITKTLWVFIDGIQDPKEAYDLMFQPWESWGFKLIMSCQENIFTCLQQVNDRFNEFEIRDFSLAELNRYLNKLPAIEWHDVPADIRNTIRKPILADIYCKISNPLKADSEYYLYDSFWNKIDSNHRFDNVGIQKLAIGLLNNALYPWTGQQILDAGVDKLHYERLNKVGWLRETLDGRHEIPHSRLLNWAIAESIVNAYQNKEITENEIAKLFNDIFANNKLFSGQNIGYVPMDVVWIFTVKNLNTSVLKTILNKISGTYYATETLYPDLLPTIGPMILPYMFDELMKLIQEPDTKNLRVQHLIKGISHFDSSELKNYVMKMLSSDHKLVNRYATKIIIQRPSPHLLDKLWTLHCEATIKPNDFFQHKNDSLHFVYKDTFGALKSCVRLNPSWIIKKIKETSVEEPVHDLAYLLANINDGKDIWLKYKKQFFSKIGKDKERSLATNICKWRDSSKKQWCIERISRKDNLLGPSALRALCAISPSDAAKFMKKLPDNLLYLARNSAPKELLIQMPDEANAQILDILKLSDIPLWSSLVYQGNESLMNEVAYDFILDELNKYLEKLLDPKIEIKKINIYPIIDMLSKISSLSLLGCLQKRRGHGLEKNLKKWLVKIGPRKCLGLDSLERKPALNILYKIGGDAFIDVINKYLESDSKYGKYDAIKEVRKRYNSKTLKILQCVAMSEDLWDDYPLVQSEAVYALCAAKQWQSVFKYIEKWGLKTSSNITEYLRTVTVEKLNNRYDKIKSFPASHKPESSMTRCCLASS
ncbi:MAG: hypothetical protein KAR54_00130, partial [Candidatus Pacebacteria bacterium]|nr:hypothetical protein [Candidatus Paceibacterota bacterium]